jgi:hypothetical protein
MENENQNGSRPLSPEKQSYEKRKDHSQNKVRKRNNMITLIIND